ncbi:MAG: type II toxin-antitoxin system RelE/ParE family toxin [Leptospiraceae bacterium]|nr:type II toxin-antitoxin system RelE/ParE family toxin [Leptospiraceae bacterium]
MSRYTIYIQPITFQEIKKLPGNVRQRIRQAINELSENPRPSFSKRLNLQNFENELWRLRIENWRIIYGIDETEKLIDIIAVRKRPPYDYRDLADLLKRD